MSQARVKELAIIGAGIAGVSAAIYAKRSGLEFDIFESKALGGQLLLMENIDNYAGIPAGTKGFELSEALSRNLSGLDIEPINQEILSIKIDKDLIWLKSQENNYTYKTLIIATGATFRRLDVPGESQLTGKGVSYCAVCDGFFFKGKTVAVIGGGNTAAEEALYLSDVAEKVFLVHRRDQLRALGYLQKEIFAKKNIEIIFGHVVEKVNGTTKVDSLILSNIKNGEKKPLSLQGVFIAIGITPATSLFSGLLDLDDSGFILTDEFLQTSSPLIWACGDCRKRPLKQLITAASEGAIASLSVYKHLRGHYISA
ncbi:MAG: FAD-dependent oxidoreductase [Candidatus Omnitrophica bacterium]|nr:FAD-dependent oxidoreductase [Candidatus Omnitrophota bacterium]